MRIAIVYVSVKRSDKNEYPDYVKLLAQGMESMGHRIDVVDAWKDDGMRLPGYEYIVVITEPASAFSGKIPSVIPKVLAAGSSLTGKKSAAFIKKSGLFSNRAIANLMRAMEKEGMIVNWSEFILSAEHAKAIGKQIGS